MRSTRDSIAKMLAQSSAPVAIIGTGSPPRDLLEDEETSGGATSMVFGKVRGEAEGWFQLISDIQSKEEIEESVQAQGLGVRGASTPASAMPRRAAWTG